MSDSLRFLNARRTRRLILTVWRSNGDNRLDGKPFERDRRIVWIEGELLYRAAVAASFPATRMTHQRDIPDIHFSRKGFAVRLFHLRHSFRCSSSIQPRTACSFGRSVDAAVKKVLVYWRRRMNPRLASNSPKYS